MGNKKSETCQASLRGLASAKIRHTTHQNTAESNHIEIATLFPLKHNAEMAKMAFELEPENGTFYLKGVVSRKKQLIPALMEAAQVMGAEV